jgi:NitT/TauT family transport system substrate-binding protein
VVPGFSFVVSEKTLASDPDMIARFLKATYRSMAAALEDPAAASAAYAQANPTLSKDVVAASWSSLASYFCSQSAVAAGSPLGFQAPADWTKGVATLKKSADLPSSVHAAALYTNRFFTADKVSTTKCKGSWG